MYEGGDSEMFEFFFSGFAFRALDPVSGFSVSSTPEKVPAFKVGLSLLVVLGIRGSETTPFPALAQGASKGTTDFRPPCNVKISADMESEAKVCALSLLIPKSLSCPPHSFVIP